jgi:hypothetical protein
MQTTANSHFSLSSFHRIIQKVSGRCNWSSDGSAAVNKAKAYSWLAKKQERYAVGSDGWFDAV